MNVTRPHYVLCVEVSRTGDSGRWRFSLQTRDGLEHLEVADVEPEARGERLELLTVVRALEALDQPSHVTLVGCSQYVRNGMQYGLPEWRSNGWRWEFFGQMLPVKNGDLWQRLDRTLRFHNMECRQRRIDPPHAAPARPHHHIGQPDGVGRRAGTRTAPAIAEQWPLSAADPADTLAAAALCGSAGGAVAQANRGVRRFRLEEAVNYSCGELPQPSDARLAAAS